jgi:hypothetical protein
MVAKTRYAIEEDYHNENNNQNNSNNTNNSNMKGNNTIGITSNNRLGVGGGTVGNSAGATLGGTGQNDNDVNSVGSDNSGASLTWTPQFAIIGVIKTIFPEVLSFREMVS